MERMNLNPTKKMRKVVNLDQIRKMSKIMNVELIRMGTTFLDQKENRTDIEGRANRSVEGERYDESAKVKKKSMSLMMSHKGIEKG